MVKGREFKVKLDTRQLYFPMGSRIVSQTAPIKVNMGMWLHPHTLWNARQ